MKKIIFEILSTNKRNRDDLETFDDNQKSMLKIDKQYLIKPNHEEDLKTNKNCTVHDTSEDDPIPYVMNIKVNINEITSFYRSI